jgi:DNA-binding MarR family transcriptional regulator
MLFGEKRDLENKDNLKEAFAKVKTDIFSLGNEISAIKSEIIDIRSQISLILEAIDSLKIDFMNSRSSIESNFYPKLPSNNPTNPSINPSNSIIPSDIPTVPVEIEGLKYPNFSISSGNRGVPTDRQTNQQTDRQTGFYEESSVAEDKNLSRKPLNQQIQDASVILNSLGSLKKEIRLKLKQMTNQEMLVFSTIYQLEEQFPEGLEYRQIAAKLKLSESSIRDYIQKLIAKGIPVDKIKLNNKKILLKISPKLKEIASLETIMHLREL